MEHKQFAEELDGFLRREFNFKPWQNELVNDNRVIAWSYYHITALLHGREAVQEKAEEMAASMEEVLEKAGPNADEKVTAIRQDNKRIAEAVVAFCKPPAIN